MILITLVFQTIHKNVIPTLKFDVAFSNAFWITFPKSAEGNNLQFSGVSLIVVTLGSSGSRFNTYGPTPGDHFFTELH